eukprot:10011066-Alexandrium_andersonii.AAC.1
MCIRDSALTLRRRRAPSAFGEKQKGWTREAAHGSRPNREARRPARKPLRGPLPTDGQATARTLGPDLPPHRPVSARGRTKKGA